jgi:hypothetical protein
VRQCIVHPEHKPRPLKVHEHHILPVEWQQRWRPKVDNFEGLPSAPLWAPQTIPVCGTGHDNVHAIIREITYELRVILQYERDLSPEQAIKVADKRSLIALKKRCGVLPTSYERDVAKQAFTNWLAAGGDLFFLLTGKLSLHSP